MNVVGSFVLIDLNQPRGDTDPKDDSVNLNNNDDEDADGVELEEPMVAPPVPGPPPAAPLEETVLAGFRDCSEEAIRYLVDVEHLEEDDPLVLGLKQHLWDKQQHLDVPRILGGCCGWGEMAPGGVGDGQYGLSHQQQQCRTVGDSSHHHQVPHLYSTASLYHPHTEAMSARLQEDTETSSSSSPMEEGHHYTTSTPTSHTDSPTYSSPHSHTTVISPGSHHDNSSLHQLQGGMDLSHSFSTGQQGPVSVMDLALLAQSNPAIASLTEEILSLLGATGGHESDLDSDLDLDQEDQGHTSD